MKALQKLAPVVILIWMVSACANREAMKAAPLPALEGSWTLHYITGPRIAFDGLYPRQRPTIIFASPTAKEVNGNTSCNPFSGPVEIDGDKISFGDIRSTMMACEGEGERLFTNTLKKITAYDINGDTLTLIMGDVAMMRFDRTK